MTFDQTSITSTCFNSIIRSGDGHRIIRKSISSQNLTSTSPHSYHQVDQNPVSPTHRHRSLLLSPTIRPSPSRDSFFNRYQNNRHSLVKLLDEAMGVNRLPHRDCDPPQPDHHQHHHQHHQHHQHQQHHQQHHQHQHHQHHQHHQQHHHQQHHQHHQHQHQHQETDINTRLLSPITDYGTHSEPIKDHVEKLPPKPYGVIKMEFISFRLRSGQGWGVKSVYIAMCLLSTMTSIENNSLPVVEPYYLSLFGGHSALSTIGIVTNIAWAVGKPPMSKVMDVFGRTEGVLLATLLYFIGAILTSSATSVTQYGIARVASALGSQGLQLAQMIIVADTSSLSSRALLTSTISSPWILTTWIGPIVGSWFKDLGSIGYRSIYGLFGLLVPLCSLWLSGVLFCEWRSIRKSESQENQIQRGKNGVEDDRRKDWKLKRSNELWNETKRQLDLTGIFLLTIGCSLILLPLTLTDTGPTPRSYAFLVTGIIVLIGFWKYESKIALSPIIPTRLLKQRTIVVGSGVCFWHFMCQYVYESYFTSFLQVVRLSSARDAQYIQESYMFTACISALICGILVRWSRRYKIWVIVGIILHSIGAILMIRTRKLDNPLPELILSQIIAGFGGGFTTLGAQLGVQAVVSHQDVGIATAVFLTVTQIGGAVGSSLAGGVWSSKLPQELLNRGINEKDVTKIVGDLGFALSFPIGSFTRNAINLAYVEVQRKLNWLALLALMPCLICSFLMENVDLSAPDERDLLSDSSEDESSPLLLNPSPPRAETSNPRASC